MNLEETKEFYKNNPEYLVSKVLIEDLKSSNEYIFKCEKGHIFNNKLKNMAKRNYKCCPICNGNRVVKGINDLWTTHPDIAKLLKNPEDGYKYSKGSQTKCTFTCPNCKAESSKKINKIVLGQTICTECSDGMSFPERIMFNLLKTLNVNFEKEKIFIWATNKRYDFYLPDYNCIIEMHGGQHYKSGFNISNRSLNEEQKNDLIKEKLAKKNGILHYIVIDSRRSTVEYIKNSIIDSELFDILNMKIDNIDWYKCGLKSYKNMIKVICDKYNEGKTINQIMKELKLSEYKVKKYLQLGTKLNYCTYGRIRKNNARPIIQLDLEENIISFFSSTSEASIQLNIPIKTLSNHLAKLRKTCHNSIFIYADEYNKAISVENFNTNTVIYEPILQLDLNKNIVNEFNDIIEIKNKLRVSYDRICKKLYYNKNMKYLNDCILIRKKDLDNTELINERIKQLKDANATEKCKKSKAKPQNKIHIQIKDEDLLNNKKAVQNQSYINERVGEIRMMNNNMEAEIIEYYGSKNITVRFSDGTIVKNRRYDAFLNVSVKPSTHLIPPVKDI